MLDEVDADHDKVISYDEFEVKPTNGALNTLSFGYIL